MDRKEKLEVAKRLYETANADQKYVLESLFPELAETEDEKIKKELIEFVKSRGGFKQEYIAWLEKQGEQKSASKPEPKFKVGDWIVNKTSNLVYRVESILFPQSKCYYLSHNGEMVLVSFTDEQNYRLWTIQDAKDGDVLCTSSTAINEVSIFKGLTIEGFIECYCSYDSEDEYCERKYHFIGKPTPATEEQRDLLFQKMKENGYEWDAEKKELKKIEPKFKVGDRIYLKPEYRMPDDDTPIANTVFEIRAIDDKHYKFDGSYIFIEDQDKYELVEQNPWSEEDEKYTNIVLAALYSPSAEGLYYFHKVKSSDVTNWFISLKDRVQLPSQWKPSDEQMETLKSSTYCQSEQMSKVLFELYQDLKKLKENKIWQ